MPFRETLELLLNADASGGIAEVRKFASEAGKSASEVESSFSKVGSAALKIGGTGMAAGGFLTALGDKERQAGEGLKASIQAAGQSYDEFEGKIEGAVKSQEHFGHTADETDNALSTLVGSFGDTNAALDRMQLVADLAAKKHIGLADAAQIVAKAHGGAGRIFKEFNIQVGENADGTKNYDGALTELSGKLQGQASASVAGFTGWLKGAAAAGEDFVAGIGEKWGPAILGVSTGLTALGGVTTSVGSGLDWLKARHEASATAALLQAQAETDVATAQEAAAGTALSQAAAEDALAASEEAATAASLGAVGAGALVVAGVGIAVGVYSALSDALGSNVQATDDYTKAIQSNTGSLEQNVDLVTAQQLAANGAAKAAKDAGVGFDVLGRAVRTGTDDFGEYTRILTNVHHNQAGMPDNLRQIADELRGAGAGSTEFGQALISQVESGKLTDSQLRGLVDLIEGLHNGYTTASGSAGDLKSAQEALGVTTEDNTKKEAEAKSALEALTAARQHDLDLINSEVGGEIGLSNAQIATRNSIDQMTQSLKDGSQSTDDHTKAVNDAESAIMNEATAAGELAAKQAEAAGVTDTATASNAAMIQELYGVMATLDPNSPLRQWLGQYIATLSKIGRAHV